MSTPARLGPRVCVGLSLVALFHALLLCAFQCDDAYLTFRTVHNALAGHGLTWNPGERVQAYTHPLWMLLALASHALTGEAFYSMSAVAIALGFLVGVGFLGLLRGRPWLAGGLVLLLACSRAFVDYAVSGLENPLLAALLVLSGFAHRREVSRQSALTSTLVLSLAALTRSDAALLLLPVTALYAVRARALRQLALGLAPLLAWELFSLVYYGSFVPNTALAKLDLEVPLARLLRQGAAYFADSLARDPLTLLAIAASCVFAWVRGDARARCMVLGVALYLLYVLRIGGDFMSGRFLSAPLVLALVAASAPLARTAEGPREAALPALLGLYLAAWPGAPLRSDLNYGVGLSREQLVNEHGIADERGYYYPSTGLLRVLRQRAALRASQSPTPPYVGALHGVAFARSRERVARYREVGFFGYFAGGKQVVDEWALADPLLARIPFRASGSFRVGHYPRPLPEGYLESREDGGNHLADPGLARAYEALRLVTRGPLLSGARWRAILELHTGAHRAAFVRAAGVVEP